jgi:hypothetical protein
MEFSDKVMSTLEAALRKGGSMHAFLSGGGLRVIRIEKPRHGKLIAYGEHPVVAEAFRITAEDFKAGGRPYGEVYGKLEEHYLTGQSMPEGELDAWVRRGATFDAHFKEGNFVFELRGLHDHETPAGYHERAMKGETLRWTSDRGVTYEIQPSRLPNGSVGSSTRQVSRPNGMKEHRVWSWYAVRRGIAPSLTEAIAAAFTAKYEEVDD